jgi:multidrug efflux pump subunit AcrB
MPSEESEKEAARHAKQQMTAAILIITLSFVFVFVAIALVVVIGHIKLF